MSQFTEEQVEEAFDMYGLDSNMSLDQYKEIVDYMGDLVDPDDYTWYNLDYYSGSSAEEKFANRWLEEFTISTGHTYLDGVIENNLNLEGVGRDMGMNGIFVSDGTRDGYFEA